MALSSPVLLLLALASLASAAIAENGCEELSGQGCLACTPGSFHDGTGGGGCEACPDGTVASSASGTRVFFNDPAFPDTGVIFAGFSDPPTAESGWGEEGLRFDGVDDWVELEPWEIGGPFSVEVYLRFDELNEPSIIDFGDADRADTVYVRLSGQNSTRLRVGAYQANQYELMDDDGSALQLAQWAHIVWTVQANGRYSIFVDGRLVLESLTPRKQPVYKTRQQHWVGRSNFRTSLFHGTMRSLAFFDHAISPSNDLTKFGVGLAGATALAACQPCTEPDGDTCTCPGGSLAHSTSKRRGLLCVPCYGATSAGHFVECLFCEHGDCGLPVVEAPSCEAGTAAASGAVAEATVSTFSALAEELGGAADYFSNCGATKKRITITQDLVWERSLMLTANHDIVLVGEPPGVTLDARGGRFLDVARGATLSLSGLTFFNGGGKYDQRTATKPRPLFCGRASCGSVAEVIHNEGTINAIEDCVFLSNQLTPLNTVGSVGTIARTHFLNNSDNTHCAGLWNHGRIGLVVDSRFEGNHASAYGGAIKHIGLELAEIRRCSFVGNSASYGAAIHFGPSNRDQTNFNLVVVDSAFRENRVKNQGNVKEDVFLSGKTNLLLHNTVANHISGRASGCPLGSVFDERAEKIWSESSVFNCTWCGPGTYMNKEFDPATNNLITECYDCPEGMVAEGGGHETCSVCLPSNNLAPNSDGTACRCSAWGMVMTFGEDDPSTTLGASCRDIRIYALIGVVALLVPAIFVRAWLRSKRRHARVVARKDTQIEKLRKEFDATKLLSRLQRRPPAPFSVDEFQDELSAGGELLTDAVMSICSDWAFVAPINHNKWKYFKNYITPLPIWEEPGRFAELQAAAKLSGVVLKDHIVRLLREMVASDGHGAWLCKELMPISDTQNIASLHPWVNDDLIRPARALPGAKKEFEVEAMPHIVRVLAGVLMKGFNDRLLSCSERIVSEPTATGFRPGLKSLVQSFQVVDSLREAARSKKQEDEIRLLDVEKESTDATVEMPPIVLRCTRSKSIKGASRMSVKVSEAIDEGLDEFPAAINSLGDALRASLIVSSCEDARTCYRLLKDKFEVLRLKNKFKKAYDEIKDGGDLKELSPNLHLNVLVKQIVQGQEVRMVAEIQIHLDTILQIKRDSHKLYNITRASGISNLRPAISI